jgi:3,4-dihydroxy 2-butanone 4-phosphate synthase / GTP cyclohydrolase II
MMQERKSFPCILSNGTKSFLIGQSVEQTIFPDIKFRNRFEEGAYYLKLLNNFESQIKITEIVKKSPSYEELKVYNLEEVIDSFKLTHPNVVKIGSDRLITKFGEFEVELYEEVGQARVHSFLHKGDFLNAPTRIHSGCAKSELFQSTACDCREELESSLAKIQADGNGSILYLKQEPEHMCMQTSFPEKYFDSGRDFHQACWIFKDLGFKHIKLITGNQKKLGILLRHGFTAEAVGFSEKKALDASYKR